MSLAGVAIAVETVTEISAGFYKFEVDWDDGKYSGIDEILFVIDATATITSDSDRYIEGRLERTDTVSTSNILTDTTSIKADTNAIQVSIGVLNADVSAVGANVLANFEALAGTWTIVDNQMIMKTAAGAVIRTFDLFDAVGAPASTQVFTRQYVS